MKLKDRQKTIHKYNSKIHTDEKIDKAMERINNHVSQQKLF